MKHEHKNNFMPVILLVSHGIMQWWPWWWGTHQWKLIKGM